MLCEPDRGPKRPTMRVPGIYAGDMNTTRMTSVNDCRLSASTNPHVRVKSTVKPCGGFVHESDTVQIQGREVNAKHALKRMQKGTQRRKTA